MSCLRSSAGEGKGDERGGTEGGREGRGGLSAACVPFFIVFSPSSFCFFVCFCHLHPYYPPLCLLFTSPRPLFSFFACFSFSAAFFSVVSPHFFIFCVLLSCLSFPLSSSSYFFSFIFFFTFCYFIAVICRLPLITCVLFRLILFLLFLLSIIWSSSSIPSFCVLFSCLFFVFSSQFSNSSSSHYLFIFCLILFLSFCIVASFSLFLSFILSIFPSLSCLFCFFFSLVFVFFKSYVLCNVIYSTYYLLLSLFLILHS